MERTKALNVVRVAREKKNLTVDQLAKKLKVSTGYVRGIEGGSLAHSLSPRLIDGINKVFGRKLLPDDQVDTHNKKVHKYKSMRDASKIAKVVAPKIAKAAKKASKKLEAEMAKPKEIQGQLPGFLEQMSNVRIEEMVREAIFKRVATRVDAVVDQLLGEVKKHG